MTIPLGQPATMVTARLIFVQTVPFKAKINKLRVSLVASGKETLSDSWPVAVSIAAVAFEPNKDRPMSCTLHIESVLVNVALICASE